jgi:FADH2 O2-dependent halogenase
MNHLKVDVAILGAGFGGSLLALVLQRLGRSVVLLDRGRHPRFAIGESSTPVADLVLRDLAIRYDLSRIRPLAKYGTWKAAYPEVTCGLKRGFSYFEQLPDRPFTPQPGHANELLVAASSSDEQSDTHWLRSDVDTFLASEVVREGIPYLDETDVAVEERSPWRLRCRRQGDEFTVAADLLVDGTGEGAFLPRHLGLKDQSHRMLTHSRALFAHYAGVKRWGGCLDGYGVRTADHPFPTDNAAQHHVFPNAWMWQLRFDNDVTSLGFMFDTRKSPLDPAVSPQDEWDAMLRLYPSLGDQLAEIRLTAPDGGLRRTNRIQRWIEQSAGPNWVLLPHTAGFVDPLNSTGIAHTLCGIERLALILEQHWNRDTLPAALARYGETVSTELEFIDELIAGYFDSFANFRLLTAWTKLYFAIVTSFEHRRSLGEVKPGDAYFNADNPDRRGLVRRIKALQTEVLSGPQTAAAERQFETEIRNSIAPFDIAGLCDSAAENMYRYTAAKK